MLELFPFQERAAATIANNVQGYLADPPGFTVNRKPYQVPCFQALSAMTGAGKTAILAASIDLLQQLLPVKPVVLWLSKGKVVVNQTFDNLSPGGKYHELLGGADVYALAEYNPNLVLGANRAALFLATVGTFNRVDKETGTLLVHRSDVDTMEASIWEALKERTNEDGYRRPLIIVYDEAQNLSDQQATLLSELEPEVFLAASATLRWPPAIAEDIDRLKSAGFGDDFLVTKVDTAGVLDEGLIKQTVVLEGHNTPMEEAVSRMVDNLKQTSSEAKAAGLDFEPKAIYVCDTNKSAFDAGEMDDPQLPFKDRAAPPILIWRYLVEELKVDPRSIAVYAQLKTNKASPLPDEFNLFKGGDKDYAEFMSGNFTHIIFNQSLQEGWDDPAVYCAYIDKSMGSGIQVTQVIGRVLRQPDATHYDSESLNTARFYVRVDKDSVFSDVVEQVKGQLGEGDDRTKIVVVKPGASAPQSVEPKEEVAVPLTALDSVETLNPISQLVEDFPDFRQDTINTVGQGSHRVLTQPVGSQGVETEWQYSELSSSVSARWVVRQELKTRLAAALGSIDLQQKKFDAIVGIGSPAHKQIIKLAEDIVDTFVKHVNLVQRRLNPYIVGPVLTREDVAESFTHSIHSAYSGLNSLELDFAKAIDTAEHKWARNVPRTGYGIPLISKGSTQKFYPDFLIWTENKVTCLDTKGAHLIAETRERKLLTIHNPANATPEVVIAFVSEGTYDDDLSLEGSDGYTFWKLGNDGQIKALTYDTLPELVAAVVR